MKKINWKNILKGSTLGILLLSLFIMGQNTFLAQAQFSQFSQDNRLENRFLTQSGNTQSGQSADLPLKSFGLAPRLDVDIILDNISSDEELSFFQKGTAIFDNIAAYGDVTSHFLNAGFGTIQNEANDAAKLKVNGQIKIESLADGDPADSRLRLLCVNDLGVLDVCSGAIDTTVPTAINGSCVAYPGEYSTQPAIDAASACVEGVFFDQPESQDDIIFRWSCYGIDGGITAECSANQLIVLDELDIGASNASAENSLKSKIAQWFKPAVAEASSTICSERDNLNDNGVYQNVGSAFVRYSDRLSFFTGTNPNRAIDFELLQSSGPITTSEISIFQDDINRIPLPSGEYLFSGDSVVNEARDPLSEDDGIIIPSGTPVSAISLVVQGSQYTFEACNQNSYLSDDEIREKDLAAIANALEQYYQTNGRYPSTAANNTIEPNQSWANSSSAGWATVATEMGITNLPTDPINTPENLSSSWSQDQRYSLHVDETWMGCNNPGQSYILTGLFDDQSVSSPGAVTCDGGRNYFKKTIGECKDPACNAQWSIGPWTACNAGEQTRVVQCQGSDGQPTRVETPCENQDGPKPPSTQTCPSSGVCEVFPLSYSSQPATTTANACALGNYSDTGDIANQWRWSCSGINGGPAAPCNATRTTYSWSPGFWGACDTSNGIQSRTLTCQSSTGQTVANSFCSGTIPATTQTCAVVGSCRSYDSTYASQPATNSATACNNGNYNDISDTSGDFRWQCAGLNGGAVVNCSAAKINTNPIAEYRFDSCEYFGGPDEVIDSVGSREGRAINNATTDTGKVGRALRLDGTNWVDVPASLVSDKSVAVSFWYKHDGDAGGAYDGSGPSPSSTSIGNVISGNTGNLTYLSIFNNVFRYWIPGGGAESSKWLSSTVNLDDNNWHHIVYSFNEGTRKYQVYIDGVLRSDIENTGGTTLNSFFSKIGAFVSGDRRVNAYIDELKIYADWLPQSEVQSIYNTENSASRSINCLTDDQKRERDILRIQSLLEDYYDANGRYPDSGGAISPNSGWSNSASNSWNNLATALGVSSLPTDPINSPDSSVNFSSASRYSYYSKGYGCAGQWYMLYYKSADNPTQTVGNVQSCSNNFTYSGLIGDGECKSEFCNSTWSTAAWGSCNNGTQTRSVNCVGSNGTITSDANCHDAGQRPSSTQSCTTNGQCKVFTGGGYTSQPGTNSSNACNAGTYVDDADGAYDTLWNWFCQGINGGNTPRCSAPIKKNGICKSYTSNYTSQPGTATSNGCHVGSYANVSDTTSQWRWSCSGINGASATTCSANKRIVPQCRSYTSQYTSQPASSTGSGCTSGSYANISNTASQWRWQCVGVNAPTVNCSATKVSYSWRTTGWSSCNQSNGTQNRIVYCQSSTGSTVSNSLCSGSAPSSSQSCRVNGQCKVYPGNHATQPGTNSSNACNAGTYVDQSDGFYDPVWNWRCQGINGGGTANCAEPRILNGTCKSYSGTYTSQPGTSTSSGCWGGNYSNISNTTSQWRWRCSGVNGGTARTCSASKQPTLGPACRPYPEGPRQIPYNSSTGCVRGTYTDLFDTFTGSYPVFRWRCSLNGINRTCYQDMWNGGDPRRPGGLL